MFKRLLSTLGIVNEKGVHPALSKHTANQAIAEAPLSSHYILPIKQHIGTACEPLVDIGEYVKKGQKIAKSKGYVSTPVHAPTSGHVTAIGPRPIPHPSALSMECICIEADGKDEWDDSLAPMPSWQDVPREALRERIRISGIAGLGGAVFPTFIKLTQDKKHPIDTMILNGNECEPYLTNDYRLMLETTAEMIEGMQIMMHLVQARRGIIALEDHTPDAAACIQQYLHNQHIENITLSIMPSMYPRGSEKQLIHALTGKEVPSSKLPFHIGVLCQNVGTSKAIYDAVVLGHPLIERVVTVSGDAMPEPGNMRVRIGTPMREVFAWHGLTDTNGIHLIHGGPMMGERLQHADAPIVKGSNGLLAFKHDTLMQAHTVEDPCIRCGDCGEVCPINLTPNLLADFCKNDHLDKANAYHLFDCIECGCCSYVCPSHIPLVHYFRYGKGQVAAQERERAFADASRARSEARERRIQREEDEKQAKAAARKKARELAAQQATQAKIETPAPKQDLNTSKDTNA